MFICVFMRVFMSVCTCVFAYVFTCVSMCVSMCVFVCVFMCANPFQLLNHFIRFNKFKIYVMLQKDTQTQYILICYKEQKEYG